MKKLEVNQLNYRLSHPAAALQSNLAKDMDKYSRIRFDYASFDAQVFGKQPLMGANPEQEMSPFSDCEPLFFVPTLARKAGRCLAESICRRWDLVYLFTGVLAWVIAAKTHKYRSRPL